VLRGRPTNHSNTLSVGHVLTPILIVLELLAITRNGSVRGERFVLAEISVLNAILSTVVLVLAFESTFTLTSPR
jgi:hypothetical protein